MAQYAQLPDGSYVEFPDEWDEAQMDEAVYRDFPKQFPDKQPGVIDKAFSMDNRSAAGNMLGDAIVGAKGAATGASEVGSQIMDSLSNIVNPAEAASVENPDTFLSAAPKTVENMPAVGKMLMGGLMQTQAEPAPILKGMLADEATGEKPGAMDTFQNIMSMLTSGEASSLMMEPMMGEALAPARKVIAGTGEVISEEGSKEYKANQPVGLTGGAKFGYDVLRGLTEMAPIYGLAYLKKNPKIVPAGMAVMVKGRSETESLEMGLAPYKAAARSNFNVWAEGIPEYVPALAILSKAGPASKIGWGAIGEGGQEMVTEVLQNVYDSTQLAGMSLKDAITGIDWGNVLYAGGVGAGAGGALGATAAGLDRAGGALAERKADKDYEKRVDEALKNIAEEQATTALSPDRGIAPKRTTQRPEDVGPAASGATAKAEELRQAKDAYDKAADAVAVEEQQLAEDEARDERTRILTDQEKEVQRKEADVAYAARQDDLEKQRAADLPAAKVEQAKQETRVQTRAAEEERAQAEAIEKGNAPADSQPTTMEQRFQKVLDEELIAELKKTVPEQKRLEEKPAIPLPGPKKAEPVPVKLTHFSKKAGLTEIDPAFHGVGIRGQESKRKQADPANWVDRSYFFLGDTPTKKDVMLGKEKYEIEFDQNKLYDYRNDPDGLRGAHQNSVGVLNISAYEKAIKEAGYAGYQIDTEEQGNTVAMFEKTPVGTKVHEQRTDRPGGATTGFFSRMTLGEGGKPEAEYKPVLTQVKDKTDFVKEYDKHRGNFDDHIRASIPGYGEVQVFVGDAIVQTYENAEVLDIGASEGSWAKTITANSQGDIKTTSVDPNIDMANFAKQTNVPGADYRMEGFGGGWKEADGTVIKEFKPGKKFDVVHEAMTFQFIDDGRTEQFALAKSMLKPEGIFLVEEKTKDDGSQAYKDNEAQKDEYKRQYFTEKAIQDKAADTLVVGMNSNMVTRGRLEQELSDQFENVVEYWDSGNCAGYAASDSAQALGQFLDNLAPTHSKYSRQGRYGPSKKPRWVKGQPLPETFKKPSGVALDAFDETTTDMPFYDDMMRLPEYFEKEKGKVWEIVNIPPLDYLKALNLNVEDMSSITAFFEPELVDKYVEKMKAGEKFPMLTFDSSSGRVSQEGRHRALAAERAGIKSVPVLVVEATEEEAKLGKFTRLDRPESLRKKTPEMLKPQSDTGFGTLHSNPLTVMRKEWEKLAQSGIDMWNNAVGWRYDTLGRLPSKELYKAERYKVLGRIASVDKTVKDIYDTFRNASTEDQRAVYDYLTTPEATPNIITDAVVRRKAIDTKKRINHTGQVLVDKGLLSEKAFLKNQDGYLPRTYLKYLLGDGLVKALMGGKKVSKMAWAKARKDIPADVRELILGEITDPAYLASKGLGTELRDIAIIDFLDWISKKQQWVQKGSMLEWEGRNVSVVWLDQEARRLERQAAYYTEKPRQKLLAIVADMDNRRAVADEIMNRITDAEVSTESKNYRQVPVNKRYGRLQGAYLRKEIYDDLLATGQIMPGDADPWESWFGYGGKGTKVTQLWKMSKVALNPPAQIRNFASNAILLHLSGIPMPMVPVYMARAANEIRTNGRYWRLAKKHGVTETTFAAQELFRVERDLLDLEARMAGKVSFATVKNVAAIVGEAAGDLYQLSEALNKTAKIIHAMESQNMSADDAAMEAQKWLFDYSLVPKAVRTARNMPLGVPFITFYYKVLPRLLETAIKRPWAYAPYIAIPQIFAMIFAEVNDVDDEDAKQLMKAFPMWLQNRGNAFLYPVKDAEGRWQPVDFSYILPWSMFVEATRNAQEGDFKEAVKSSGIFGGPIPSIATAIKTNRDPYTDRYIVAPGANPKDQVMSMLAYSYQLAMPTFLTQQGFAGKMLDAINEDIIVNEEMGRTVLTPGQATLRLFGVNVYPMNPERTRGKNIERMQKQIEEIRTDARRKRMDAVSDVGNPEQKLQAINADAEVRIQKIAKKIETYAEGSEVPEALTLDR